MDVSTMFNEIKRYHKIHGHTQPNDMQVLRNNALALMMELAELVDSTPWKPWRKEEDQPFDKDNATREVVDIIFFLGGICEVIEISPEEIVSKFKQVLANNFARLKNGYSLVKD